MCTPLVTEEFCALETGQQPRRGGGVTTDGGMVVDFTGLSTEYRRRHLAPRALRRLAAVLGAMTDARHSGMLKFSSNGERLRLIPVASLPPTFGGLCRQVSSSEVKYLKL